MDPPPTGHGAHGGARPVPEPEPPCLRRAVGDKDWGGRPGPPTAGGKQSAWGNSDHDFSRPKCGVPNKQWPGVDLTAPPGPKKNCSRCGGGGWASGPRAALPCVLGGRGRHTTPHSLPLTAHLRRQSPSGDHTSPPPQNFLGV